ncbi:hypothetical protein ACFLZK_01910 [Patescibacteria group bacterium]
MAKKSSKKKSKERRLQEVLKAHAKSGVRGEYLDTISGVGDPDAKQPKKLSHRLHLDVIRTDLVKTGLFVIFVIVLLIILKNSNLELDLGIYK